ncbi:hypothetical protein WR25_16846 [Diploscapter pachys]|uniref:SSD domain-containing protein n=1 Tax=Diploscapter pachys TaxID=2018661 RepID=A0A2A2LDG6_9BILA|nr:hypothetical protein WR25_16846 [Diploscapter pachys]
MEEGTSLVNSGEHRRRASESADDVATSSGLSTRNDVDDSEAQLETTKTGNAPSSHSQNRIFLPGSKMSEFLANLRGFSLSGLFCLWGEFIGRWPAAFLIASAIMICLSGGMHGLKLKDNVRDGYTARNSRSRLESTIYREFLGSEGDPVMTTVLMLAKDNGSMHRLDYLADAVQQLVHLSNNLSVTVDAHTVGYRRFCGHYCDSNLPLLYFYQALTDKTHNPVAPFRVDYPIAHLKGNDLHLERNLFGVRTGSKSNITNIEYVELVSASFLAEVKTREDMDKQGAWELAVFDYCREYSQNPDNKMELLVLGAEIVDTEMNKDSRRMIPYFIVGFTFMLGFVFTSVGLSAYYYSSFTYRILIVSATCTLIPCLAITTTLGLSTLVGNRTNSLMLIMPFLIMGIGVNDAFLAVHGWMREARRRTEAERLGKILEDVGPSITTTTFTNVIAFLIGCFGPTEEISIFCLGCAMALSFSYIYTITLLCPILSYCAHDWKKRTRPNCMQTNIQPFARKLNKLVAKILASKFAFFILLLGGMVYWSFGIWGTVSMSARLDTDKILPIDTPIRRPHRIVERLVWAEYYPVTVIVNKPIDISDIQQYNTLMNFVQEFERLPSNKGANFTMFWLRAYEKYFNGVGAEDFDYFDENTEVQKSSETEKKPGKSGIDYSKLAHFLGSPLEKHHRAFLHLDYNQTIPVRSFSFMIVCNNQTTWDDRINVMLQWREIADRYPSLNASVWNVNGMFVDQMLLLKPLTFETCVVTLVCMFVVCMVFIQNPVSVVLATLSIASISFGVMGYLSFWHLELDPVTLCSVLISIGQSVDFVAHTTYHYQVGLPLRKI